ncbi:MAG: DNA primase small subunit PriS [Methanomicrobiales archaeon]|nr:DNA primase small subunit PriS [Methanomicrobiales archaeon]
MKPATLEFVKQQFTEYYRRSRISVPPALEQREWGFIFFDPDPQKTAMRRHMAFGTRGEVTEYLRTLVPAHAFHSAAYYAAPAASTMGEKGWSGADLIFDLDADHLMRGPYDRMLSRVKEETEKLLAMLTDELGFHRKDLHLVFSGGRGYHIHIRDLAVRGWGSQERRELVDYVCGTGLDPGSLLGQAVGGATGWRGRYMRAVREYLMWLGGPGREEAMDHLTAYEGVGKEGAARFLEDLDRVTASLAAGDPGPLLQHRAFRTIAAANTGKLSDLIRAQAALADEPVTTDTKRLIRLPTSLHGGSGFRVTPLELADLADFDPLVDAVVFGDRKVRVDLSLKVTMPLQGSTHALEKGPATVPEALAVFLCCRGIAEIAGEGRG